MSYPVLIHHDGQNVFLQFADGYLLEVSGKDWAFDWVDACERANRVHSDLYDWEDELLAQEVELDAFQTPQDAISDVLGGDEV